MVTLVGSPSASDASTDHMFSVIARYSYASPSCLSVFLWFSVSFVSPSVVAGIPGFCARLLPHMSGRSFVCWLF